MSNAPSALLLYCNENVCTILALSQHYTNVNVNN